MIYNSDTLRRLSADYPMIAGEEISRALSLIAAKLESDVVQGTPAGVGGQAGLRGSIFGEVRKTGSKMIAVVGTPLKYGEVIELGRRPGSAFPPLDAIELWLRRKVGLSPRDAHIAAYPVARRIALYGFKSPNTQGFRMFEKAFAKNQSWITEQLDRIPARIAQRITTA